MQIAAFAVLLTSSFVESHTLTIWTRIRDDLSYKYLSTCQQLCVAGSLSTDPAADVDSVVANTCGSDKMCFCSTSQQLWIFDKLQICMQAHLSSCGRSQREFEMNFGTAVSYIDRWCEYRPDLTRMAVQKRVDSPVCDYSGNQSPCGQKCCDAGYYCFNIQAGDCRLAGNGEFTATGSTGATTTATTICEHLTVLSRTWSCALTS
jgi:hypothetical protein